MSAEDIVQSIQQTYKDLYPLSKERHANLRKYMPSGHVANMNVFKPHPLHIERAEGAYVFSCEQRKLLDLLNGYSAFIHGHGDSDILDALDCSHKQGFYFGAPTLAHLKYCELLSNRVPSFEQIRISTTGTEATLFALRTARAYTKKTKFLKFFGGYHGTHDCVAVSPKKDPIMEGVAPNMIKDVIEVEFNDFEQFERAIREHKNDLAAVIIEPYLGGAGSIAPLPGYLEFIRKLTMDFGILLIFDEIVTFRLHEQGAQGYFGVEADLVTLGKIAGGGMPIGVLAGRQQFMRIYDTENTPNPVHHGGTSFGYEAGVVAGYHALKKLTQETINQLNDLGEWLQAQMEALFEEKGLHIQMNRMGSIFALHYTPKKVSNFSDALSSEKEVARLVHLSLLNKGIYTAPYGKYYILSTAHSEAMLREFIAKFDETLTEIHPFIEEKYPHLISAALVGQA